MSPAEIAVVTRLRLAAELDQDREGLRSLASAIERLQHRTDDPDREWLRVRALSFELERWYTAMEATLERVLRALDGGVPAGPSWHDDLLRSAAVPIEGLRPAVISPEAVDALREVCRLRHFAHNGYDREPDPARVDELARVALGAQFASDASLVALGAWLRSAE